MKQPITNDEIINHLERTPFIPHPALRNAHAQTLIGTFIRRRFKLVIENTEARIFDIAPGVQVLAHCSWQKDRASKPTLLIVHGMEGSTESRYMLGTAEKALEAGYNVVRVNFRNCGGTEHLTPTLYHAGLTDDIRQTVAELIERDGLSEIYLAGFSLGGNVVLKLAGEYGEKIPPQIRGVAAVSPSIEGYTGAAPAARRRFLFREAVKYPFSARGRPQSISASHSRAACQRNFAVFAVSRADSRRSLPRDFFPICDILRHFATSSREPFRDSARRRSEASPNNYPMSWRGW